jgi:hypothetical protein
MTTIYDSSTTNHCQLAALTETDEEYDMINDSAIENESTNLSTVALMPATSADRLTAPIPMTTIEANHAADNRITPVPTANHPLEDDYYIPYKLVIQRCVFINQNKSVTNKLC